MLVRPDREYALRKYGENATDENILITWKLGSWASGARASRSEKTYRLGNRPSRTYKYELWKYGKNATDENIWILWPRETPKVWIWGRRSPEEPRTATDNVTDMYIYIYKYIYIPLE